MRPLRLDMKAIGPFCKETTVAFDQFADHDLFLIHGPTGIGKSFIFDAICYALYGESPSGREANLKSDYAQPDTEPSIVFTFSVGQRTFQAKRTLAYSRMPKRKGKSDWVSVPETGELAELGGWPDGERRTLATKKPDIRQRCTELMGLDANQFSQVVLLPQDEFRRLLLADTQDRERLLGRLFGAGIYEEIERELNDVTKGEEEAVRKDLEEVRVLLDQARDSMAHALPQEGKPPCRESLQRAVDHITSQLPALHQRVEACSSELKKSSEALEAARHLQAQFDRRAELALRTGELRKEKEREIDALQQALDAHREAAALMPLIENLERSRAELVRAQQQNQELRDELQKAERKLAQSERRARGITELETRQTELTARIDKLRPLVGLSEELDALLNDARDRTGALSAQRALAEEARARAEGIERALVLMEAEHEALRADAAALASTEAELSQARSHSELIQRSAELAEQIAECEGRLAAVEQARRALECEVASVRQRRERGLAAELAVGLEQGRPCPVCGSTEHPLLATRVDQEASLEAVQRAEERRDGAVEQLQNTAAELSGLRARQQATADQLKKGEAEHPGWPLRDARTFLPVLRLLQHRVEALQYCHQEAQKLQRETERVRAKDLLRARELAASATEEFERTDSELKVLQVKLEEKTRVWRQGIRAEEEAQLPAAKTRKDQLQLQLARLETERRRIPAEIVGLQTAVQEARERTAQIRGSLDTNQRRIGELAARTQELEHRSGEDVAASRFGSVEELKASHGDESWLERARATVEDFARRERQARVLLEQLEIDLADREHPDLGALEEKGSSAEQALREATRREDLAQTNLEALQATLESIRKLDRRSGVRQRRLEVLGKLDKQVRGLGTPRVSLQRFFLAQRLEEVLIQASRRLTVLSRGRFTLTRASTTRDARAAAGLDLNIFDSYTGTERPARTLSGGQMFLASLSLALGLADVVQARSGGTIIETLFIDEGFGSLDEETLELALDVLNQLRRGRMVGVISHVPELKRQIASRIEVRSAEVGSSVTLCRP